MSFIDTKEQFSGNSNKLLNDICEPSLSQFEIKGMYDTAPLQIVTTFAIFTALRQIGTKCKAGHKLIAKIGEHSFTIYLLHVLILTKIMHPLLVGISRWYLRMPIEFAGTLLVSYLMAEVFDSVVVRNLKKVENRKRNIEKSLDN